MKHKHADLIHAWADGAEIEILDQNKRWVPLPFPVWDVTREYRIKPEEKKPVVRWLWADEGARLCAYMMSDAENCTIFKIKLEWSRTEFPE